MPIIPISPSLIQGALPYTAPLAASSCKITERPINPQTLKPQHDCRFVPMQFSFASSAVLSVDLGNTATSFPFTQLASMYVDNSNSTHDVTIFFPDSGWQSRVAFGDTVMLNPITKSGKPFFYVILDSGNATNATDVCNVFALDTFIPPSRTSIFERVVTYGYSSMFSLQPQFTQSNNFFGRLQSPTYTPVTLINASEWFITSIYISANLVSSGTVADNIQLLDNGTIIYESNFYLTAAGTQDLILIQLSGLNIISGGGGPLTMVFGAAPSGNFTGWTISASIGGGILTP